MADEVANFNVEAAQLKTLQEEKASVKKQILDLYQVHTRHFRPSSLDRV